MGPGVVARMSSEADVPHFAFPFRFGASGSAEVVEQDTIEEIEQGVKVLVLTNIGERLEVPDFGIEDLPFKTSVDMEAIHAAAVEWDERAGVTLTEEPDRLSGMVRHLLINVTEET